MRWRTAHRRRGRRYFVWDTFYKLMRLHGGDTQAGIKAVQAWDKKWRADYNARYGKREFERNF